MESRSSKPCFLSHAPWQQADDAVPYVLAGAVPYVLAGALLPSHTNISSMLCEVNAIKSYHFF